MRQKIENYLMELEKAMRPLDDIINDADFDGGDKDFGANDFAKAAKINIERTEKALREKLACL